MPPQKKRKLLKPKKPAKAVQRTLETKMMGGDPGGLNKRRKLVAGYLHDLNSCYEVHNGQKILVDPTKERLIKQRLQNILQIINEAKKKSN